MPGETFSAGTIFLQVVPVFGDVQKAITREAKDWNNQLGDEMEKGGRKAGERAGKAMVEGIDKETEGAGEKAGDHYGRGFQSRIVAAAKNAQKAIDGIDFKTASENSLRDLERVKKALKDLGDTEINADFNSKKALAQIAILEGTLESLVKGDHEIEISVALLEARKDLKKIAAEADRVANEVRELKIKAQFDGKQAERAMGAFEKRMRETAAKAASHLGDSMHSEIRKIKAELEALSESEIGIDVSSDKAMAKLEELQAQARRLALTSPNIDVKVDAGKAEAELALLLAAVRKVDGKDINIRADVNTGSAVAKVGVLQSLLQAKDGSDAAANSFRSFNAIVLAAVTLIPALIPVLGAAGGALLAIVPILGAVGAGLGAMIIGFSGIGNAVQALGKQADQAGKDTNQASKTIRAASYSVQDAKQSLADAERAAGRAAADSARQVAEARRSAAQSIADAVDRQKEAQQNYRDSVLEVRDAEKALRDARKQAAQDQMDLQDKIKQNQLDIRQATLDLFDATVKNNSTAADGASTNYDKEAANVAMGQAQLHIKELRDTQAQLAAEQADQQKTGIDGSKGVKSAQDNLTKAIDDQQKAQKALGKATQAVDRARVEGARKVADAVRNQQRAEADGARSIARAQEQLRRAQESYGQALKDTGDIGSAAMHNVDIAMGKLGPAGQRFALFLFGLQKAWQDFRSAIQEAMLPGVQSAMETIISKYGPRFQDFMVRMAATVGSLFQQFADSLSGPAWQGFFQVMNDLGPALLQAFGATTIKFLEAFASIMTAVAPYADKMALALLSVVTAFANWAASPEGQAQIMKFMNFMMEVGPSVVAFLGNFIAAVVNLSRALAPWGKMVLKALDGLLKWIADMDPATLGMIAGSILGLVVAFQAAVGMVALLTAGGTIFATTLGTMVFGSLAVIAVLIALSIKFEFVRKIIHGVTGFVHDHIDALMKLATVVGAAVIAYKAYRAILNLVKAVQLGMAAATYGAAGATYATSAAAKIAYGITRAWTIAQLLFNAVMSANPIVLLAIGIGIVIAALIYAYFHFTKFRHLVDTVFGFLRDIVGTVFHAIKGFWKNILWPVLDLIMTIIWKLWKLYFKVVLWEIRNLWHATFAAVKWVWTNILKPVFDAIIEKLGGKKGLQSTFEKVVAAIKTAWDALKKIIGEPIKFVINTVIRDGLVKGFNKVAKFVGSDPMKFEGVDWKFADGGVFGQRKQAYATGGVMPGYTPGHDVHHFKSPTGGSLHLSGGESIMRPEFTAAVGSGWTHRMNAVARAEGVRGVRRALGITDQSYFLGGVIPLPGAHTSRHTSGYSSAWAGDLNVGSGYDDYGMAVHAWMKGMIARMKYIGDNSYGRWVDINHDNGQSSRYAHLSAFREGLKVGARVAAGETIGYVGDLGNTGTPPTSHLHFEVNGGHVNASDTGSGGGGGGFPGWIMDVAKHPLGYVKNLVSTPIKALGEKFGSNPMVNLVKSLPGQLFGGVRDKIFGMIPSPIKAAAGVVGDVASGVGHAVGDAASGIGHAIGGAAGHVFAKGGILPYNGTMMYDSGGYLPPGLTSVVNLTGKPEPVFTDSQFSNMTAADGSLVHYEPHFHKSDLTARDVAFDLDVEFDRLARKSKRYGGS